MLLLCHITCKWLTRLKQQWLVCFILESLNILLFLNKFVDTSYIHLNLVLHLHLCHSCLFVFTRSLCLCFLRQTPPTPYSPTLAALMQFHPQRWRADSYNYASVCEMNHWAADWAAWWETSILSSTTECSQPSTPSLCWCPGLAHVHIHCHCWERRGVVCNRCTLFRTNYGSWRGPEM